MAETTYIHDYKVKYEPNDVREGIRYLREHLEPAETKVFFEMAKKNNSCEFEDKSDRNYTLWHKEYNTFILTRRKD